MKLILAASARTSQALEASPVLHVATCMGAHRLKEQAAAELGSLLLTAGADLYARWAASVRAPAGYAACIETRWNPRLLQGWARLGLADALAGLDLRLVSLLTP